MIILNLRNNIKKNKTFIRGVNESFQISRELLNPVSLKDTTKGGYVSH